MAGFWNQTRALFRKNLTYQKRRPGSNLSIILFPAILFLLLGVLKHYSTKKPDIIPEAMPVESSPLVQVPANKYRAVKSGVIPFNDLPDESCREKGSCPVTVLLTGNNRLLGESVAGYLFPKTSNLNSSSVDPIAAGIFASDPDALEHQDLCNIQSQCSVNSTYVNVDISKARCLEGLPLWRNNDKEINAELFRGYMNGNEKGEINEIMAAFSLLNSSMKIFQVDMWYNSTDDGRIGDSRGLHIPRALSMVWNAYLQVLLGPSVKMVLEFVGEMVVPQHADVTDMGTMFGEIFFILVVLQLFPVIVSLLVYEKQKKLRIMTRMHGLGDSSYWLNAYLYFFVLSSIYMLCFVGCGSIAGLSYFRLNSYSVQCAYYFVHINLMISLAFLLSTFFSNAKSASVVAYMIVFGTWILSLLLFNPLIEDTSFPRMWLILLELFPGFSMQRAIYEFSKFGTSAFHMGTYGMRWHNLRDHASGLREILIIMSVEWLIFLAMAYYVDQVLASGSGFRRSPLFCFRNSQKKRFSSDPRHPRAQNSQVLVRMDKQDVDLEIEKVEELLNEPDANYPIIAYNLRKTYPVQGGIPEKHAVKGFYLAVSRGECFGLLGPNGAGKTSIISMMTGLTKPSSGTAYIEGMDLKAQMKEIHSSMGVCPQDDLLWDSLTGKEHLYFYGSLKNLIGQALRQEVEDTLRSVNLLQEESANKQVKKYSGGMKRRLSVAISLIGKPKVVYMDEPSTGLDPASKDLLWDVIKKAKQDRAIILTTHSMEEAEHLCDRIGIFVDGNLQCIGSPDELKERYGGTYTFTLTASPEYETNVTALAHRLSRNAKRIYHIAGTQKFELPKHEVQLSEVFKAVMDAKKRFNVQAWEISETTLEDVFAKVANEAQESTT